MPEIDSAEIESLDVYISYGRLRLKSLVEFSSQLSDLVESIRVVHSEMAGIPISQLSEFEIDTVHTGDSIKFKFRESWMPSISSNKESDIIVGIPKKLGIPLVIGWLLLTGAKQLMDIRNVQLDNELKSLEIKLKQSELQKTTLASHVAEEKLRSEAARTIVTIYQNLDFQKFEINGVTLFNRTGQGENRPTPEG
jgi:hypothetical protein